jgi:pilus assembly protein Flp/PilA
MLDLVQLLDALRRDGRGVTALEYGLIAGAIALAISGAVIALGGTITGVFSNLANGAWSA